MHGAHDLTILTTLAGALAVALLLGWLTQRIGLSTLVGYMLAGIVVGPHTPGFVADAALATELAEIGVILLMFGVGMHFHPQELLRVWRIAVPGAIAQSVVAALAGWAGGARLRLDGHAAGIVFGMALAVASTVVLLRMLVANDRLDSRDGHVAVGWLIVEDIFTVVALVVLPLLALDTSDPGESALAVGRALGMVALCAVFIWLGRHARACSPSWTRIARDALVGAVHADRVRRRARHRDGRRRRSSTCPWRWAPSSAGSSSASRASARRRRPTWPRSATCSRRCSSSRWACCSTRSSCCSQPRMVLAALGDRARREAAGGGRDRHAPARHRRAPR